MKLDPDVMTEKCSFRAGPTGASIATWRDQLELVYNGGFTIIYARTYIHRNNQFLIRKSKIRYYFAICSQYTRGIHIIEMDTCIWRPIVKHILGNLLVISRGTQNWVKQANFAWRTLTIFSSSVYIPTALFFSILRSCPIRPTPKASYIVHLYCMDYWVRQGKPKEFHSTLERNRDSSVLG
jgi:hypothetical protein